VSVALLALLVFGALLFLSRFFWRTFKALSGRLDRQRVVFHGVTGPFQHRQRPAWRPRFRNRTVVRFMNQQGGLKQGDAAWGPFRIAYLQYASVPLTFFSLQSICREPAWRYRRQSSRRSARHAYAVHDEK